MPTNSLLIFDWFDSQLGRYCLAYGIDLDIIGNKKRSCFNFISFQNLLQLAS